MTPSTQSHARFWITKLWKSAGQRARVPIFFSLGMFWLMPAIFGPSAEATAQVLLVDTGAPTTPQTSLSAAGAKNCTPQPSCGQSFQFWAGQFTLQHAASINSVQIWMGPIFTGGALTVKLYADTGGIPSTALYSQTYNVATGLPDGWFPFTFSNPNPVLAAGTYWVAFEPVAWTGASGSGLSTNMDGGAPNPLLHYAVWNDRFTLNQFGNGYIPTPTGQRSFGMRVSGTSYPDLAFGTLGRASMSGTTFGFSFSQDNISGGLGVASIFSGAGEIPAGFALIRAGLFPNSLSTGAWTGTSVCFAPFQSCTQATGSSRSVAFRSFTNSGTSAVTIQANALLHGGIINNAGKTGSAIGRVYLFDPTLFSNTLGANGDAAQFLVGSLPVDQDITALFAPQAVLASAMQMFTTANPAIVAPLNTGLVTIPAGGSITVMFDVTTITPEGTTVDFFSTLAPAANLFTDPTGNAVTQMLGVGPAVATPAAASSLVLTPSSASNPVGTTQTLTVTAKGAGNVPVSGAVVYFTIANGPNAGSPVPSVTDANGQATFTYTDAAGAGADVIQAAIGNVSSNTAQMTWTSPGPLDHIVISPANGSIPVGGSQPYTAQGFDVFHTSLGDVTSATTFGITPDGSCTGASCGSSSAGPHTVTGTDNGKTAQAVLQVGGAVDNTPPQITCASPDALWHAADVNISCTASDSGSGLVNAADAGFSLSTNVAAASETATAQTGTHVVCDKAGNCATAGPIGPISVDKKGPAVSVTTPANQAVYQLSQGITASYSCTDGGSGLASCTGTAANNSALDTTSVGNKNFTVTGTDAVGNKTQATNGYMVAYAGSGICDGDAGHQILQPVNADGSSVWKQGRTVPVKFRVCDAKGISIGTPGVVVSLNLVQIVSGTTQNVDETISSTTTDSAFHWDPTAQQWIFNLSTSNLPAGQTYRFVILLNDGSSISFQFGLK